MGSLASGTGVSRSTLYRLVGDRDWLIGEVVWSLAQPYYEQMRLGTRRLRGAARLRAFMDQAIELVGAEIMQRFLVSEPVTALRVMTSAASPVEARIVAFFEETIAE